MLLGNLLPFNGKNEAEAGEDLSNSNGMSFLLQVAKAVRKGNYAFSDDVWDNVCTSQLFFFFFEKLTSVISPKCQTITCFMFPSWVAPQNNRINSQEVFDWPNQTAAEVCPNGFTGLPISINFPKVGRRQRSHTQVVEVPCRRSRDCSAGGLLNKSDRFDNGSKAFRRRSKTEPNMQTYLIKITQKQTKLVDFETVETCLMFFFWFIYDPHPKKMKKMTLTPSIPKSGRRGTTRGSPWPPRNCGARRRWSPWWSKISWDFPSTVPFSGRGWRDGSGGRRCCVASKGCDLF